MGYAQSKLVAETLCVKAAQQTGLPARVLRIGQVVGDTEHGIWNTTEAIPLMIQAATTTGALPELDEYHRWLPVNTVAGIVADISLSTSLPVSEIKYQNEGGKGNENAQQIFNIINPSPFHWTRDLLPYLQNAGLQFEQVEQRAWIKRLRESNPDPVANPPIKLVDFFAAKYDTDTPKRAARWETGRTRGVSATFRDEVGALDQGVVGKMVGYFLGRKGWAR